MAPNLVASCRAKNNFSNVNRTNQIAISSEKITRHIYAYLLGSEYLVDNLPLLNSKEVTVFDALKSVVNDFKVYHSEAMSQLTSSLEVTTETVSKVFFGVSNELFCEGITWSRIVTFVMFASEMAIHCLHLCCPEFVVEEIFDSLMKFTRDNLDRWIEDHDGWDGIINFANGKKRAVSSSLPNTSSPGWAKNALYGTVKVLGTLAYLANLTDPQESFPLNCA